MKSLGEIADDTDFEFMCSTIETLHTEFKPLSDAERMEHTANSRLKSENEQIHIIKPEMLPDMDNIELQVSINY